MKRNWIIKEIDNSWYVAEFISKMGNLYWIETMVFTPYYNKEKLLSDLKEIFDTPGTTLEQVGRMAQYKGFTTNI